jgi:ABC-type multidrug transport system permease subunit
MRLLQMSAWGRWSPVEVLFHLAALIAFTVVLGFWAYRSIRRKLTT